MDHLHSRPFESLVHGDLKTSNLPDDGSSVTSDFGPSRVQTLTKTMTGGGGNGGSLIYVARRFSVIRLQADAGHGAYSFSMIMYKLATSRMPFAEANVHAVAYNVQNGRRPAVPDSVPQAYPLLMHGPETRPAFSEIVGAVKTLCEVNTCQAA